MLLGGSEAYFATLVDRIPALIFASGPHGLQYANLAFAEFFGAVEKDNRQHDWTGFMHPQDRTRHAPRYFDALARHKCFEAKVRLRRSDGEYRWMKVMARPHVGNTELLGHIMCCLDIDDLKRAEKVEGAGKGMEIEVRLPAMETPSPVQ